MFRIEWPNKTAIGAKSFVCGYCGNRVGPEHGWLARSTVSPNLGQAAAWVYLCHLCNQPTYFSPDGKQIPAPGYGTHVSAVPKDLDELYNEARACTAAGANTGAVLLCRKILMNIAVAKGAKEGLRFIEYVEYLSSQGFVPPDGKAWVDHIRTKGNEATHEIALMTPEDAEDLVTFVEGLLRFIYEFPARVAAKKTAATGP